MGSKHNALNVNEPLALTFAQDYPALLFGNADFDNANASTPFYFYRKEGERMAREYNPQLAEMGEKIVARRVELGMTATELAIYVGITSAALSRIENGQSEAKVTTLMKIADILAVPLSYFQPSDSAVSTSNIPPELLALVPKLKNKTHSEQRQLMQMFATMIDAI